MAKINFPDPTSVQTYEAGGITWTWNDTLGVWSTEISASSGSGDLFLSKVNDDTAEGAITFQGQTTHEGGVSVTGGNTETLKISSNGTSNIRLNNTNKANHDDATDASVAHSFQATRLDNAGASAVNIRALTNLNYQNRNRVIGVQSQTNNDIRSSQFDLFAADVTTAQTLANSSVTGFRSSISTGNNTGTNGTAYNFYAAGDAPNFFAGSLRLSGSPAVISPHLNSGADISGVEINTDSVNLGNSNTSVNNEPLSINRYGAGIAKSAPWIGLYQAGIRRAYINCNGGTGTFMLDERRISSSTNLPSTVEVIKSITAKVVTDSEGNQLTGFTAHELQEHIPEAVIGTRNATEAIGTLTDAAGVVTADVTEPETLPYGETWVQTGTRPVYQGVDQTKLIPLLTKALQEALDKIETLETRLSNAGIA